MPGYGLFMASSFLSNDRIYESTKIRIRIDLYSGIQEQPSIVALRKECSEQENTYAKV